MIESQSRFDIIPGGRPYTTSEMLSKLHENDFVECSPPNFQESSNPNTFSLQNNNKQKRSNTKNKEAFLRHEDNKSTTFSFEDDRGKTYETFPNVNSPESSPTSLKEIPEQLRQYVTDEVWESYSPAKRESFANLLERPNSFFYRNRPPGDPQILGTFSLEEEEVFFKRIDYFWNELKIHDRLWGLFAVPIKGRVGYQCMNFYRHLIDSGKIKKLKNRAPVSNKPGDGNRRRARCQVSPEVQEKLEKEAYDFIKECLLKDSPTAEPQIRFEKRTAFKEAHETENGPKKEQHQSKHQQQQIQLTEPQQNNIRSTLSADDNINFANDYDLTRNIEFPNNDQLSNEHIMEDYDVTSGLLFSAEREEKNMFFDDTPIYNDAPDMLLNIDTGFVDNSDILTNASIFNIDVDHNSNHSFSTKENFQTDEQKAPNQAEKCNPQQKRRGRPPKRLFDPHQKINGQNINGHNKQKKQKGTKYNSAHDSRKNSARESKKKNMSKTFLNKNATTYVHFAPDPVTGAPMEQPFLDPFAGVVMDKSSWHMYFTMGAYLPYDVCAANFDDLLMVTRAVFDEYRNQIVNVVI